MKKQFAQMEIELVKRLNRYSTFNRGVFLKKRIMSFPVVTLHKNYLASGSLKPINFVRIVFLTGVIRNKQDTVVLKNIKRIDIFSVNTDQAKEIYYFMCRAVDSYCVKNSKHYPFFSLRLGDKVDIRKFYA